MKNTDSTSSSNQSLLRLQEIQSTLRESTKTENDQITADAVRGLVEYFNSIYESIESNQEDEDSKRIALESLTELLKFISSPLNQMAVDALSFELPKLVVKYASLSHKFCEIAECVIDRLISKCNSRDMLAIICEALDAPSEMFEEPAYFCPLLSGLSKVFISLQRRHFEQIKETLPAALKVVVAVSSELHDENINSFKDLIDRAIQIGTSVQEVCKNVEGRQKEQIRALLGLFVLQIMALTSNTLASPNLNLPVISQLSQFLPFCNLSYLGLVTGEDIEALGTNFGGVSEDNDSMSSISLVKQGAFIAVVWGDISDKVVNSAHEDMAVVKDNLRSSQSKRWQTLGMLKHVLSSIDLPWKLREHALDFFLSLMEGNLSPMRSNECANFVFDMPSLYSAEQVIEMVIIYAPDVVLRKKAFAAMKMVLADLPPFQRFDVLKASITNNKFPSMIAILLDRVREEMFKEISRRGLPKSVDETLEGNTKSVSSPFLSKDVLELVEIVLKPPAGGPPSLEEDSDAVLSALNLYRYILIAESKGNTNYTGVLSQASLRKAYEEWLKPLQTLVSTVTVNGEDCLHALNPVQSVLDRCIELIQELQHTA
ncbi:hypothetical protein ACHQM5_021071 [Ranunculus cassubicifolius]